MEKILIVSLFLLSAANAFVIDYSLHGQPVRWSPFKSSVLMNIHSANSNLTADAIKAMTDNSAARWNAYSNFKIFSAVSNSTPSSNTNDIYFSNNNFLFSGSGVSSLTIIRKDEATGYIQEADIVINQDHFFDSNPLSTAPGSLSIFLEDVLTKELGRILGLGHENNTKSTMMAATYRGQHTLETIDISSIKQLYGDTSSKGSISGNVFGGHALNKVGIFGTYVQAISSKNGEVVSSAVTDGNGYFTIKNLDLDISYFLALEPLNLDQDPPNHYRTAKKNFCTSSDYEFNFYGSCDSSKAGKPIAIWIDSSSPNRVLDAVTIGCDLKVPTLYKNNKFISEYSLSMTDGDEGIGASMSGFFTRGDEISGNQDKIRVNLSGVSIPSANFLLEIKIITQGLNSNLPLHLNVENQSIGGAVNSDFPRSINSITNGLEYLIKDFDSNNDFDIVARVPLNAGFSVNNNFLLTLTPLDLENLLGANYKLEDFFPSSDTSVQRNKSYLLIASIVENDGFGTYPVYSPRKDTLSDNSSCLEGINSYSVNPFVANSNAFEDPTEGLRSGGVACGTVGLDSNDDFNGPANILLGVLLSVILMRFKRFNSVI